MNSRESIRSVLEPFAWLMQILTGILMVFFVTYHFYLTHMTSHEALSYGEAISRLNSLTLFYAVLLLVVTFHAFNGIRAIILDTNFGAERRKTVNAATFVAFAISAAYGMFLLYRLAT